MIEGKRGTYWMFEGVGRAGKNTAMTRFQEWLRDALGRESIVVEEPGGTPEADILRKMLFELTRLKMIQAREQVVLVNAARKLLIDTRVRPALEEGIDVISGRGAPSTAAYQVSDSADHTFVDMMCSYAVGGVWPDAVFYLAITAQEHAKRVALAGTDKDPFDERSMNYTQAVVDQYEHLCETKWMGLNWQRVEAIKHPDFVLAQIKAIACLHLNIDMCYALR